jgi:3',5'-cyclic-nucleotide phosphodiesterase
VYVCTTGKACISKVTELNDGSAVDLIPTLVLIDVPHDDKLEVPVTPSTQTPSPTADHQIDPLDSQLEDASFYGSTLLQYIITDIQQQSLSGLVVPVVVMGTSAALSTMPPGREDLTNSTLQTPKYPFSHKPPQAASINIPKDQQRAIRYIDIGAVDVLPSPIRRERLPSLTIHVYRVYKEYLQGKQALLQVTRARKRSWVGLDDLKPYAYLREAMVSNLMDGICSLNSDFAPIASLRMNVPLERRNKISRDIGSWSFCALDFNEDELIYCAILMLQHALAMPELESWRMPTGEFSEKQSVASRSCFVPVC